jgi:hypothetical protein
VTSGGQLPSSGPGGTSGDDGGDDDDRKRRPPLKQDLAHASEADKNDDDDEGDDKRSDDDTVQLQQQEDASVGPRPRVTNIGTSMANSNEGEFQGDLPSPLPSDDHRMMDDVHTVLRLTGEITVVELRYPPANMGEPWLLRPVQPKDDDSTSPWFDEMVISEEGYRPTNQGDQPPFSPVPTNDGGPPPPLPPEMVRMMDVPQMVYRCHCGVIITEERHHPSNQGDSWLLKPVQASD